MAAHWVVGYLEAVGFYDHGLHMQVVILGDDQRLTGVYLILTTNQDELDVKLP